MAGVQVTEDLDSALDDLLKGSFDDDDDDDDAFINDVKKSSEARTSIRKPMKIPERRVKDSKPVPISLTKEVSYWFSIFIVRRSSPTVGILGVPCISCYGSSFERSIFSHGRFFDFFSFFLTKKQDNPTDFQDPKFLSTSNPRWVQAGLDQRIIDVLSEKGITRFTPVQGEAFDPIVAGRDVIGRSRTGTGKTLAFGLPSITRIVKWLEEKGLRDPDTGRMERGRPVSMLILCPTRELARQVQDELATVSKPMGLFTEVFHGGVSYDNQSRALRQGLDILVGTPGRVIDHINRGNLNLGSCDLVVLDEADEMLSMGFAEDVETILNGLGDDNGKKPQVMMFSATTPPWIKQIGRQYQQDVLAIDATGDDDGARVAKTVRHTAIKVPPGIESKRAILEDIIAIEISKDMKGIEQLHAEAAAAENDDHESDSDDEPVNHIAVAAAAKRKNTSNAMQQRIFGKTIVFVETKREADELVSGGVFKSLTAQALHGDVGQKQRDATLAAFRAGAFNVLVATDVAARGIDVKNVDLVVQLDPPRDVDTYVHRSGRTGRAGSSGVSVLLFGPNQERDIVRIERDLGHNFQFELIGPPSIESALRAAAKTSAVASTTIPEETSQFFREAAAALLKQDNAEDVVARCLAAISRRSNEIQSRSLITGEIGMATVEMSNSRGRPVAPGDVMFTVSKLSRMSKTEGDFVFDSDIGKIDANPESGVAYFDMGVEDAKKLIEFSKTVDAGGAVFNILEQIEIERDHNFGRGGRGGAGRVDNNRRGGPGGGYRGDNRRQGGGGYQGRQGGGGGAGSFVRRESRYSSHDQRGAQRNDRSGYARRDDDGGRGGGGGGYSRSTGGGGGVYSKAGGSGRRYSGGSGGSDGW
jgi:ATP-dependent RNA helicase DDX21